jgi:hypothetical protein
MSLPEAVARDRDTAVKALALLLGREAAAGDRRDRQRLRDPVGLEHDADALRHVAAEERHVAGTECDDAVEHVRAGAQRQDVPAGHVERADLTVGAGNGFADANQAFGVRERQRPEQKVIHRAEHRGVGADAERQNRHRDRRVARCPMQ